MSKKIARRSLLTAALITVLFAAFQLMNTADATQNAELSVGREGNEFVLSTPALGKFYRTTRRTSDMRLIQFPETNAQVMTWREQDGDGKKPFYAVSMDGKSVSRATETSYEVMLRYGKFDPLVAQPVVPRILQAKTDDSGKNTYIVQFVTQPLEEYRKAIADLGGKNYIYLPNHAELVAMDEATRAAVEELPFVRWVGRYEPAYKLEEELREGLLSDSLQPARYNVMLLERGGEMQDRLAARVRSLGGKVEMTIPQGFRVEVTLDSAQLLSVAQDDSVLFVDRWSAPEADMDVVREIGGGNFIENTLGFRGQGVRAEVMDGGLRTTHGDFQAGGAPIIHGTVPVDSHGTATYGINFGRGTANPAAKGMLPEAQGIIASYNVFSGGNRYTHTAELKQEPYRAVYQSNSWGGAQTTQYTTISAEMDDILFINDFCLLNSQSNTGNQTSRPQAWAKNVVSIGGISHFNTAGFADDRWTSASVGPATDGRLKPELAHFYDNVMTTTSTSDTAYTTGFGGTSAATPITAGHFGIFFQMWHNGLFGNPTRATVFDSRPHMTTAKAVMINTAIQWDMSVPNRSRAQQGFGRVDVRNLYELRNKMLIVDETDVLTNMQSKTYSVRVSQGSTDPLKVTMTYNDPMGSPAAARHRINDLTLKVTAPDGTVYWGNNNLGVGGGMWSTAGGAANVVDTVENVFIQTPQAGNWIVEVVASEINADARIETPGVADADYALVASGIERRKPAPFDYDGDGKADVSVFRPSAGSWYLSRSSAGFSAQQFGVATDRLAPADYDGDGRADIAVWRSGQSASFYILNSTDNSFRAAQFGTTGDVPVSGDFDGDGKADLAVYRNGASAGAQSYFFYRPSSQLGADFRAIAWGSAGDKPVVGDFDGDGKADAAVFRASNSTWYVLKSSDNQLQAVQFGISTDKTVPADYDGDGKTDVAVYRDGIWYVQQSQAGFRAVQFGNNTDVPAPADYDGDGKADVAVFRNGIWYLLGSTSGFSAVQFGVTGDIPTETAYVQ